MPTQRTQPKTERPAPYQQQRPATMVTGISPGPQLSNWQHLDSSTAQPGWPSHMSHYPASTTEPEYPHHAYLTPEMSVRPQPPSVVSSPKSHSLHDSTAQATSCSGKKVWTEEMDDLLFKLQGDKLSWDKVARHFPGKSANACRKRFNRATAERKVTQHEDGQMNRLFDAYNREGVRQRMWSIMCRDTGEDWQEIERKCFAQGYSKMTKGGSGNVHKAPQHSTTHARAGSTSRYDPIPHHEYDPREDSGIGLGLGHHSQYLPNVMHQVPVSMAAPHPNETMLHPDPYTYRP